MKRYMSGLHGRRGSRVLQQTTRHERGREPLRSFGPGPARPSHREDALYC